MKVQRIADGAFAFVQGDGSWGWSNAGLVAGDRTSLLVDTFFDLRLTRALLEGVRSVSPAPIGTLVNTHHNGDHCWGNQLVEGATIVGHTYCRDELLRAAPPSGLAAMVAAPGDEGPLGYLKKAFSAFDFDGITVTPPTVVFDQSLTLFVDGREVRLMHFGPGHTLGDIVAYVPDARVLYAGDLLFLGSTPLVWEGSILNWLSALGEMLDLRPEVVVPGHGPVCGPEGLVEMRGYLELVAAQGRELHAAGLPPLEAARRFEPGPYSTWLDSERIVLNFLRLWHELEGHPANTPVDTTEAFAGMADLAARTAGS